MIKLTRRYLLASVAASAAVMATPALAVPAVAERTLVGHGIDQLYDVLLAMPYNGVGVEHIRAIHMTPAEYNLYVKRGLWRIAYEATYRPDTDAHGDTMAYLLEHDLIQVRDPQVAYDEGLMRQELAAWEKALGPNPRRNACHYEQPAAEAMV